MLVCRHMYMLVDLLCTDKKKSLPIEQCLYFPYTEDQIMDSPLQETFFKKCYALDTQKTISNFTTLLFEI